MKTMTSRQKKILELLTDAEGWITAKQISMRLNVSDRTIKTEIPVLSEMLEEEGIRIISGRGKGFCVGREDRGKLIEFLNRNQPENLFPDILMTLLEVDGIELEELCDTYYTSVSYMEGKLREIRNFFIQEGNFLTLVRIKSRLSVVGSEKKKRQMMQMVIMDHQTTLDLHIYEKYLDANMLFFIEQNLLAGIAEENLQINDINIVRIIVYTGIAIQRICQGHMLPDSEEYQSGKEQDLADRMAEVIGEKYHISIQEPERSALASYIAMNRILGIGSHVRDIEEEDRPYLQVAERIISRIKREFILNLTKDEELIVGLTYHIKRLVGRKYYDDKYVNPILNDLRDGYPYIYEVAIYFGQCLKEILGLDLDENEIGCIAIHLAAAIERLKSVQYKAPINIRVVCHMGYANMQFLTAKLQSMYPGDVIFQPVMSSYYLKDMAEEKVDLILSTTPIEAADPGCPIIYISPYLTKRDIERINEVLSKTHPVACGEEKGRDFFSEELFFPGLSLRKQEDVIRFLSEQLYQKGYVKEGFFESAMRREGLSSTAAQNRIAIPHPLEDLAFETVIAVASLEKPIRWGERSAQLIFALAVRREDKYHLREFYELFASLTENVKLVEKLIATGDFREFKNYIQR